MTAVAFSYSGLCSTPSAPANKIITDFTTSSSSAFRNSRAHANGAVVRSLLTRRSPTCSTLEQGAEEARPSTGENAVHNALRPSLESPSEWREKEEIRQAELAAELGVSIRRRPPAGAAQDYVGSFQFRLQNEGNTPRNILEEIVWYKDTEVAQMREKMPLSVMEQRLENLPPARDFVSALRERAADTSLPGLIAEVKKASPSRGVLQPDFDPVIIAQAYESGGAACLSVLTDSKYFQGSFENLALIREAGVQCPLLCKEFVVDAWQIYYACTKGADAILLIAAVLPDQDLHYMSEIAKSLGMAVLVEVHDRREMDRVLVIPGIDLIGINNRNLGCRGIRSFHAS